MHLDANFLFPCNVMVCRALLPRISIAFVAVKGSRTSRRVYPEPIDVTTCSRLRDKLREELTLAKVDHAQTCGGPFVGGWLGLLCAKQMLGN